MRVSETKIQFSMETEFEEFMNDLKRSSGKKVDYIINRYMWDEFPKEHKVPKFPLNIDIESCSKCQILCDHCFRQYMDMGENANMSMETYKKIIDNCGENNLFTLKFSMRGEPTMNPHIVEMVAYAKNKGIKEVWINTNGGLLTEELSKGLVRAGVDWITVSFDGLNDRYEAIRKPLKYEETLKNLKNLRRIRDEEGANTLLNVQSIWSAIKDNKEEYKYLMKSIVDKVAFNYDMNFKEYILVPDDEFVCLRLWQRIAITSEGDFLKCPSDFQKEEVLGNSKDYTVKEAWDILQGAEREKHLDKRKKESNVCKKCHHGSKKKKIEDVINKSDKNGGYIYEYSKSFEGHGVEKVEVNK